MMTTERLIYTDLAGGNNKFYHGELNGSTVRYTWGRIGEVGKSNTETFVTDEIAQKKFTTQINSKLRKGYTRQQTVANGVVSVAHTARVQIEHNNDPETAVLIDFLIARNIHAIEGMTNIRLEAGRLTTPLGPVTGEGLDQAQALLLKLADPRSTEFDSVVNQYLRIIPRVISRRRVDPKDLFGSPRQLEVEQTTIDSLRAVVDDLNTKTVEENPTVFETKLEIITSGEKDFARINKYFKDSLNTRHTSANMKLSRVWAMDIKAHSNAFEVSLGGIKELWHGTKDANLLSILKTGFIIPKAGGTIQLAGRMFGNGVYFSDQSTKSLNYATSFWGGNKSQRCFMMLNDVAMGKPYTPTSGYGFNGNLPKGYDSCFAQAGKAGVMNNEMIVYRTSQVRPTYLCEFA